jgi:hypothetical protein
VTGAAVAARGGQKRDGGKQGLRGGVGAWKLFRMMRPFLVCVYSLGFVGCIHVSMDPIQVHAVVDVNVKMEKAVTDLLSDIYGDSSTVNTDALSASSP